MQKCSSTEGLFVYYLIIINYNYEISNLISSIISTYGLC